MTNTRKTLLLDHLRAFVAHSRLWLVELMVWLAQACGLARDERGELVAEVREVRHAIALLVFAEARHGAPVLITHSRTRRPLNFPAGCRRGRETSATRLLWRTVPQGVGLRARVKALHAAIDAIDVAAARFRKVLSARAHAPARVLTRAPFEMVRALAGADAVSIDTS